MAEINSKPMLWAGRVLWALFVAFTLFDITIKLIRLPIVETTVQGLGLPAGAGFYIGVMELAILALYVWPRTAVLGAILVAALMGGTAATNFIAHKPLVGFVLFGPYLAVFAWAGLWLRDPALRVLIPLRRSA